MRGSAAVAVALCALVMSGCAGAINTRASSRANTATTTVPGPVSVPDLAGTTLRHATCSITAEHLRWRLRGSTKASSGPLSGCGSEGVASSLDDIRVTGQTPAAGTLVPRRTVVVLDTICTSVHPCA